MDNTPARNKSIPVAYGGAKGNMIRSEPRRYAKQNGERGGSWRKYIKKYIPGAAAPCDTPKKYFHPSV